MFEKVIGQNRVKQILENIYKSGRLAHAYIFYGKSGTGKDALAIEFARLINNEPDETNMFHTQFFNFITALPAGGGESDDNGDPLLGLDKKDFFIYRSEIEKKSDDYYHKIAIPKANNIRINSIRHIKKNIYFTGKEGKKKIYLISEADRMSAQSSNALLKILEEPPKNSLLILTTSRLSSLLPTIIGRCQIVKFDDIPVEEIINYIGNTYNDISDQEAKLYANLSYGSIAECNSILESNTLELRDKVIDYMASLLGGKTLAFAEDVNFVTSLKDKQALKQFLSIMLLWFRDLSHEKAGFEKHLVNQDKLDRLNRFNANFNFNYYDVVSFIEEAIKEIDMNINQELILYNLSFKLKSSISKV